MSEQAPAPVDELERQLRRRTDEIGILTRVAAELGGTLELDRLLGAILASMDEVFGFRHAMVLLHDAARAVLTVAASRGYDGAGLGVEVPIGQGVIGVVGKRKKSMRMGGVGLQRDYVVAAGHGGGTASAAVLPGLANVASVVAIPLVRGDDLIGVFYVESPEAALFSDGDFALIEAIASQAAVAIQNARLHRAERERLEELRRVNADLTAWNEASSRFVPYEFLAILGRQRLPDVRRGDHAALDMSTFFSDVRGYTSMVEEQAPEENFAFINEYLTAMEAPIQAHGGFIDSYRGDGIMALFAGCADDAVLAGIDSLRALSKLNEARAARGTRPLRMGIGIDTGRLMLGTIGGEKRLSAGVIGDSANTASRIESLTKRYGACLLISDRTRSGCRAPEGIRMRLIDRVRPHGKAEPVALYEVLEGLSEAEIAGKVAGLEAFEQGLARFQAGDPGDGLVHFAAALKACPTDRAAQLYIGRCWNFIENGVPADWDGVLSLAAK